LKTNGFEKYAGFPKLAKMKWEDFLTISIWQIRELGVSASDEQKLLVSIVKEAEGEREQKTESKPKAKTDFAVGENCFTMVCEKAADEKESDQQKWLKARITHVNDNNTYDIFVYNSGAHGVPSEAVDVPRNMLKKSSVNVMVAVPEPKKKTLDKPQFQQGDRVRVFGLRSHTTYNGMYGKVLLYIPGEKRYQVQLDTQDVIAIRKRNVALADERDSYEVAVKYAKKKLRESGSEGSEHALSGLISKLLEINPETEPEKVGEFAVGYLIAMEKLTDE